MKKLTLATSALITGCVTFSQMDSGLEALKGTNIEKAFAALGYPDQKQEFGKDTVYTWSNKTRDVAVISTPQTTFGTVGSTNFYATGTDTDYIPVEYSCKIQIATNDQGVIKNYNYEGNMGGCEGYISRLNSYFKK